MQDGQVEMVRRNLSGSLGPFETRVGPVLHARIFVIVIAKRGERTRSCRASIGLNADHDVDDGLGANAWHSRAADVLNSD